MNKYLIGIIGILVIALSIIYSSYTHLKEDRNRLYYNQQQLLEQSSIYGTDILKYQDEVRVLELTVEELQLGRSNLVDELKKKDVKIKQLQSVATTGIEVITDVKTKLRDTIIQRDTLPTIVQIIDWSDDYTSLKGIIDGRDINLQCRYNDTLFQTVTPIYKKFLFLRVGIKGLQQKAWLSNPHANIAYQEMINIKN